MRHDPIHTHPLFADMDDLVRRIDRWFASPRGLDGAHGLRHHSRSLVPRFRTESDDEGTTLVADVPGMAPDGLEVRFEGDTLVLQGRPPEADDDWEALRKERPAVTFERRFRFAEPVDADGIHASLTAGVLRVRVPRRAPATIHVPIESA